MKSNARKGKHDPKEKKGYYTKDENGQEYFNYGRTRIKVIEHFPEEGKTITELIEELILREARLNDWFKE